MALINLKFLSEVLGRNVDINVVVPQRSTNGEIGIANASGSEKYKTLLLLHGLSDDNSIWLRRSSIERYATEHGIAVVMPSGDRGFYTDMKHGDKYFTFIGEEVLKIAREFLPLSDKREDTFVAGNSMGGYGAFKIALKHPDKYCAAIGLSSVADINKFMDTYTPELKSNIFGDKIPQEEDLFYLLKNIKNSPIKPKLYSCIGKGDFMYSENVELSRELKNCGCEYAYYETEGVHDWDFWDSEIRKALNWLVK